MNTPEQAYKEMNEASRAAKDADKKFITNEYDQMYSVLQDVLIDSITVTDKILRDDWDFEGVKQKKVTTIGSTSVHTFSTPDGEFRVKVTAELI